MITYVDTSTLIKLIIDEAGSPEAEVLWDRSDVLACVSLTYVEARAALAAAHRRSRLTEHQHRRAILDLDDLWTQITIIDITEHLIRHAADLAEVHALRGYDAVHLAGALMIGADIVTSADRSLIDAAAREGFHVADPVRSDE